MFKEECGLISIVGDKESSNLVYLGLYSLQHRGQEAFGISSFDSANNCVHSYKKLGLVADRVKEGDLQKLRGSCSIGHVRYSTQGEDTLENIQPFIFRVQGYGQISIAHNGNLTNAKILQESLEKSGSIFTTTSDSEVFIHLLAKSKEEDLYNRIKEVMSVVRGAYSLLIMSKKGVYAVKDPYGFRPLVIGKKNETYICASETCALDLLGAHYLREVEPGEIVFFGKDGSLSSSFPFGKSKKSCFCSFEPIYFSRPDSKHKSCSFYDYRKKMGVVLAEESFVDADFVIPVPDSGVAAAMGYANKSNLPFEFALVRNHYVGRTFIEPSQSIRDFGVKIKLNSISSTIKGKRVVVVDDSLVRGTTSTKIIRMIRQVGAKEIHFRVASPPITHSCFYGVSTPTRARLLAAQKQCAEIKKMLEVDSLAYLSLEGLKRALNDSFGKDYCYACFNGDYQEKIYQKVELTPTDLGKIVYKA